MNFEPGDLDAEPPSQGSCGEPWSAENAKGGKDTERTEADTEVTEDEPDAPHLLCEDFRGFPSASFATFASNPTRERLQAALTNE